MDETCRLRRDEGYEACEDEAPLFAHFFWRNRKVGLRSNVQTAVAARFFSIVNAPMPSERNVRL